MRSQQAGLGTIAVIMILVILGGLSAAIISLSTGQQLGSAQDVLSAQAWQVALAGSRVGIDRAMTTGTCGTGTETWASPDYPAFSVTTTCTSKTYNDGETAAGTARVLLVFNVTATATNGTVSTVPGYVERQRVAVAYCELRSGACVDP